VLDFCRKEFPSSDIKPSTIPDSAPPLCVLILEGNNTRMPRTRSGARERPMRAERPENDGVGAKLAGLGVGLGRSSHAAHALAFCVVLYYAADNNKINHWCYLVSPSGYPVMMHCTFSPRLLLMCIPSGLVPQHYNIMY
jgi:hypothetical protein